MTSLAATPQRTSARMLRSAVAWIAWRLYPLALLLLLWQALVSFGLVDELALPAPADVWERARAVWSAGTLPDQVLVTVGRIFAAFGLALAVGVALGIAMGRSAWARDSLRPAVRLLFPIPKVALYPAMLIILGLEGASKIGFGFAEAVFPIALSTAAAASQVDARLVWSARTLGKSQRGILLRVILPGSVPGILTGARIGLIGALVGVFVGEMIAGSDGLGQMMVRGWNLLETADVYVALVAIGLVGVILDQFLLLARARLLRWSAEES